MEPDAPNGLQALQTLCDMFALLEIVIAAFTGIGSVAIGIVALWFQHAADAQTLLIPQALHTPTGKWSMVVLNAASTSEGVHLVIVYDDGTCAFSQIGRLGVILPGQQIQAWSDAFGPAYAFDETKLHDVVMAVTCARTKTSRWRWKLWLTRPGDESLEPTTWWRVRGNRLPTPAEMLKRAGVPQVVHATNGLYHQPVE